MCVRVCVREFERSVAKAGVGQQPIFDDLTLIERQIQGGGSDGDPGQDPGPRSITHLWTSTLLSYSDLSFGYGWHCCQLFRVSDHKGTPSHEAEVVKEPGGGILRKGSIEVFAVTLAEPAKTLVLTTRMR